jgi:hypothetical protein
MVSQAASTCLAHQVSQDGGREARLQLGWKKMPETFLEARPGARHSFVAFVYRSLATKLQLSACCCSWLLRCLSWLIVSRGRGEGGGGRVHGNVRIAAASAEGVGSSSSLLSKVISL